MSPIKQRDARLARRLARPSLAVLLLAVTLGLALRGAGSVARAYDAPDVFVGLPALNLVGDSTGFGVGSVIHVQNVGVEPTSVALLVFDRNWTPAGATPIEVVCSGLLQPGTAWERSSGSLPTKAFSGVVLSFKNGFRQGEMSPPISCEYFVEQRLRGVWPTSWDFYTSRPAAGRFPFDWFAGNPFGGQPVVAEVRREGPGNTTPAHIVSDTYAGVGAAAIATFDQATGAFLYALPDVRIGADGVNTWLHLQNAGDQLATIQLSFRPKSYCGSVGATTLTVAPGVADTFNAAGLGSPGSTGGVLVRSTEPLAVLVDLVGRDVLWNYTAAAGLHAGPDAPSAAPSGGTVLYGAYWPVSPGRGEITKLYVQNLGPEVTSARVTLTRPNGMVIGASLIPAICPGSIESYSFDGSMITETASIRVESLAEDVPPEENPLPAQPLAAVMDSYYFSGSAAAYSLVPQHQAFEWPDGRAGSDVLRLAVPTVRKQDAQGSSTELALLNVNPMAALTDIRILVFDQVGYVGTITAKLAGGQVTVEDAGAWTDLPVGFDGSAVVEASLPPGSAATGLVGAILAPFGLTGGDGVAMSAIPLQGSGTFRITTPTPTPTASATPGPPTVTPTMGLASATPTSGATPTVTSTVSGPATATSTPQATASPTGTPTVGSTPSGVPTGIASGTSTSTDAPARFQVHLPWAMLPDAPNGQGSSERP